MPIDITKKKELDDGTKLIIKKIASALQTVVSAIGKSVVESYK